MSAQKITKRGFIRHSTDIPIEIQMDEVASNSQEYLKNISTGGLCFKSKVHVKTNSIINIKIPLTKPVFKAKGRVVWCKKIGDGFDVGVEFIDEHDAFRVRMVEQVCYIQRYKTEIFAKEGRVLTGTEAALEWISKYAGKFPGTLKKH
ncbi:PilZ domain-containing protein [Elusimicrobiota bacterium]